MQWLVEVCAALTDAARANPPLAVAVVAVALAGAGVVARAGPFSAFEADGWLPQMRGMDFLLFAGFFHIAWRRIKAKG